MLHIFRVLKVQPKNICSSKNSNNFKNDTLIDKEQKKKIFFLKVFIVQLSKTKKKKKRCETETSRMFNGTVNYYKNSVLWSFTQITIKPNILNFKNYICVI